MGTDYGRPERKQHSLHGRKFNRSPKFLGTAEVQFVCHIGPNMQYYLNLLSQNLSTIQSHSLFPRFQHIQLLVPTSKLFLPQCHAIITLKNVILRRKPLHIDRLHIQTITFNKGILGKEVVFFFLSYLCCLQDYTESKSFYISPVVVLCFSSQASVLEQMFIQQTSCGVNRSS